VTTLDLMVQDRSSSSIVSVSKPRHSSGDEIPQRDIALFYYPSCVLHPDGGGFPWDDLRKILHGGQRMTKVRNGEEILPKVSTP